MINAINIGKRINALRKAKHISQERMAEDLGMYQADISNLERAMNGSGIHDLSRLDMIAEYFGVDLMDLLTGHGDDIDSFASKIISEGDKMKDYVIGQVKYDNRENERRACLAQVELTAPNKKKIYVLFCEFMGNPGFFKSDADMYDIAWENPPKGMEKIAKKCFLKGEDYVDIFTKVEMEWLPICRYLIYIASAPYEEVKELIGETIGKKVGEIEAPVPEVEPYGLIGIDYNNLSVVYRYRLMVEAEMEDPSVYDDIENTEKLNTAVLEKLKKACASEDAYQVWKADLIEAKAKEVMSKKKLVVCKYMFIGVGEYEEIIPEEEVPDFQNWIDGNGSALFFGFEPATPEAVKKYVAQHIADDLICES